MDNVIFCENFANEIVHYINTNNVGFTTLFVTTKQLENEFKEKINFVENNCAKINRVILPKEAKNSALFREMLKCRIEENVSLIVCFSSGAICDIVKTVATDLGLNYILIPSAVSSGAYLKNTVFKHTTNSLIQETKVNLPLYIVVDNSVLVKTNSRLLANAYGRVVSSYLYVLDLVYIKATKQNLINTELVLKLEKLIKQCTLIPNAVLKTPMGKINLFKTLLQIDQILNELKVYYFSQDVVSMLIHKFTKQKLCWGEVQIVSAIFVVELFNRFFKSNINVNYLPNIQERLKRISLVFKTDEYGWLKNLCNLENIRYYEQYFAVKKVLQNLCYTYSLNLKNCYSTFKNLYNDKAVFINKIITKNAVVNAVCLSPDVYVSNNIITLMRNVGCLDFNA